MRQLAINAQRNHSPISKCWNKCVCFSCVSVWISNGRYMVLEHAPSWLFTCWLTSVFSLHSSLNEHPQDIRKIIPSSHLLIQSCPVPYSSSASKLLFAWFSPSIRLSGDDLSSIMVLLWKRFMSFKLWALLILNWLLTAGKKRVWDLIEIKVETNFLSFGNCALVGGAERALWDNCPVSPRTCVFTFL